MKLAQDMKGRPIAEGDIIAYALTAGRSANLAIYRVVGFGKCLAWCYEAQKDVEMQTVQAVKLAQSYGRVESTRKYQTLAMCDERALVINETAAVWAQ